MKRIVRLDDDDIVKLLKKHYKADADDIVPKYIKVRNKKTGEIETRFFIEVEKNEK